MNQAGWWSNLGVIHFCERKSKNAINKSECKWINQGKIGKEEQRICPGILNFVLLITLCKVFWGQIRNFWGLLLYYYLAINLPSITVGHLGIQPWILGHTALNFHMCMITSRFEHQIPIKWASSLQKISSYVHRLIKIICSFSFREVNKFGLCGNRFSSLVHFQARALCVWSQTCILQKEGWIAAVGWVCQSSTWSRSSRDCSSILICLSWMNAEEPGHETVTSCPAECLSCKASCMLYQGRSSFVWFDSCTLECR